MQIVYGFCVSISFFMVLHPKRTKTDQKFAKCRKVASRAGSPRDGMPRDGKPSDSAPTPITPGTGRLVRSPGTGPPGNVFPGTASRPKGQDPQGQVSRYPGIGPPGIGSLGQGPSSTSVGLPGMGPPVGCPGAGPPLTEPPGMGTPGTGAPGTGLHRATQGPPGTGSLGTGEMIKLSFDIYANVCIILEQLHCFCKWREASHGVSRRSLSTCLCLYPFLHSPLEGVRHSARKLFIHVHVDAVMHASSFSSKSKVSHGKYPALNLHVPVFVCVRVCVYTRGVQASCLWLAIGLHNGSARAPGSRHPWRVGTFGKCFLSIRRSQSAQMFLYFWSGNSNSNNHQHFPSEAPIENKTSTSTNWNASAQCTCTCSCHETSARIFCRILPTGIDKKLKQTEMHLQRFP